MSIVDLSEILPWNLSLEGRRAHSIHPASDLGLRVSLWSGDITRLKMDAIVNAANRRLAGGGGVDGAIHRASGSDLHRACLALKGCPTGSAKITRGFHLPADYIIHCVGPIGEKPDLLRSTYQRALELCTENELQTVAFPCISTGAFSGLSPTQRLSLLLHMSRTYFANANSSVENWSTGIFCTTIKSISPGCGSLCCDSDSADLFIHTFRY
ncbi:hypothetical protein EG68_07816 [Paragonimus skrjabini miyazakii]|uniref:Macro domain-containing protein n=1 Tax=Paragonimus skrjabini miyazakii TaxID=59628 RepID=A0A8S9Y8Z3_9TREM|nr:hypothetical protein EG68_07816 [Paragonimus skrjabini miyazakii]